MSTRQAPPFKWPFPPSSRPKAPAPRKSTKSARSPSLRGRSSMFVDVVMVVFWGASIPGFMWLGTVCGF